MELKSHSSSTKKCTTSVQIVPLWNWNSCLYYFLIKKPSSNCTFMELKLVESKKEVISITFKLSLYGIEIVLHYAVSTDYVGSNCTFMELKWSDTRNITTCSGCSNCTFMELKSLCRVKNKFWPIVQIVPLWNWNVDEPNGHRIKVLFKLYLYGIEIILSARLLLLFIVQIVPLWNWNKSIGSLRCNR